MKKILSIIFLFISLQSIGQVIKLKQLDNGTYYLPNWGFVTDGVTDNSTAANVLMDTIKARYYRLGIYSVNLVADSGVSIFSGALLDITNANSQILLPNIPLDSPTLVITLTGKQRPPRQHFTSSPLLLTGGFSIWKTTLTGGTGTAAMISGHHEVGFIGPQNNVVFNVYNMVFETPPNPSITPLYLRYHQAGDYDGILCYAGSLQLDDITEPTNTNSYGIVFPEYNHTPCNSVGNVDVWGFYYGWMISERTDIKNISSWGCKYVGEMGFGYHASTAQVVGSYACTNGIKVTGATSIRIYDYQMENFIGGWQGRTIDLDDPSNYLTGDIVYQLISGGAVDNDLFSTNGSANLNGSNSSAALSIDSIGRVKYWNGDDTSRRVQIANGSSIPVGNYWIEGNRMIYKMLEGTDTVLRRIAIQDSIVKSPSVGAAIIEDAFTGSNGTDIDAHTIAPTNTPSATWVDVNGGNSITIQSNKAQCSASSVTNYYVDANTSDCVIEAVVRQTSSASDVGIMFRYVDDGNYYTCVVSGVSQVFRIQKKESNSYSTVATTSFTNTTGVDYTIRIVLNGDDISATVNGGDEITYNSSTFNTADKHGLWVSSAGSTETWDDFTISTNGFSESFGSVPIVQDIFKVSGVDSIYFVNAGITYAIKDSTGVGSPGGSTTEVQFNDGGSFGGDNNFTWDKTNNKLAIGSTTAASGRLHIATTNDTSPTTIANWDSRHTVLAGDGSSTGGGLGVSYSSTSSTATISSIAPGVAWKNLHINADSYSFNSAGITLGFYQASSGNVGIKTSSTTYDFNVSGNAAISGELISGSTTDNGDFKLQSTGGVYSDITGKTWSVQGTTYNGSPAIVALGIDTTTGLIYRQTASGSGETNTASNLGGGLANYSTKVGVDLRFNSFNSTDFSLASNVISLNTAHVNKNLTTNTTDVGNVGAGVDDLMTYSIPAGQLATNGDYLEFEITVVFAANANNKQVTVVYGATTIYASGAQAQNDGSMVITGRIIRTGAATQRITFHQINNGTLFTDYADYVTAGETLSGAVTLKATGEATSNNDIVEKTMIVKYVPVN